MTADIAEMIARLRPMLRDTPGWSLGLPNGESVPLLNQEILAALLDAAEAGIAARDAALEEAAKVAEAVDPEKPANWLHPRHKIAFAIRALRSKP